MENAGALQWIGFCLLGIVGLILLLTSGKKSDAPKATVTVVQDEIGTELKTMFSRSDASGKAKLISAAIRILEQSGVHAEYTSDNQDALFAELLGMMRVKEKALLLSNIG